MFGQNRSLLSAAQRLSSGLGLYGLAAIVSRTGEKKGGRQGGGRGELATSYADEMLIRLKK